MSYISIGRPLDVDIPIYAKIPYYAHHISFQFDAAQKTHADKIVNFMLKTMKSFQAAMAPNILRFEAHLINTELLSKSAALSTNYLTHSKLVVWRVEGFSVLPPDALKKQAKTLSSTHTLIQCDAAMSTSNTVHVAHQHPLMTAISFFYNFCINCRCLY